MGAGGDGGSEIESGGNEEYKITPDSVLSDLYEQVIEEIRLLASGFFDVETFLDQCENFGVVNKSVKADDTDVSPIFKYLDVEDHPFDADFLKLHQNRDTNEPLNEWRYLDGVDKSEKEEVLKMYDTVMLQTYIAGAYYLYSAARNKLKADPPPWDEILADAAMLGEMRRNYELLKKVAKFLFKQGEVYSVALINEKLRRAGNTFSGGGENKDAYVKRDKAFCKVAKVLDQILEIEPYSEWKNSKLSHLIYHNLCKRYPEIKKNDALASLPNKYVLNREAEKIFEQLTEDDDFDFNYIVSRDNLNTRLKEYLQETGNQKNLRTYERD